MSAVNVAIVAAAGAAGLASLPHCLVMCGPLAVSACSRAQPSRVRQGMSYLLGRLLGYSAMGAAFASLGQHFVTSSPSRWLRTLATGLLISVCLVQAARVYRRGAGGEKLSQLRTRPEPTARSRVRSWYDTALRLWRLAAPQSALGVGLMTSWLPCGALVSAWLLAAATGDPLSGSAAMLVFGAASSPALVIALLGQRTLARLRDHISPRLATTGWLLVAAVLLMRLWTNFGTQSCH